MCIICEDCDGEDLVLKRPKQNGWMDGWIMYSSNPSIHPSKVKIGLKKTGPHITVLTVLPPFL
jgi:hypothetical protein